MKALLQPWQLLLLILAGWINCRQQDAIEYILTENRVLRAKLGKKRILLNDEERRRLAVNRSYSLPTDDMVPCSSNTCPRMLLSWSLHLSFQFAYSHEPSVRNGQGRRIGESHPAIAYYNSEVGAPTIGGPRCQRAAYFDYPSRTKWTNVAVLESLEQAGCSTCDSGGSSGLPGPGPIL